MGFQIKLLHFGKQKVYQVRRVRTEYLSRACRDLYIATGDTRYAHVQISMAEWVWGKMITDDLQIHYSTGPDATGKYTNKYYGRVGYHDNGVATLILLRAFALTSNKEYFEQAKKVLKAGKSYILGHGVYNLLNPCECFHYLEQFRKKE